VTSKLFDGKQKRGYSILPRNDVKRPILLLKKRINPDPAGFIIFTENLP